MMRDHSLADPVTHADLEEEVSRLRAAVLILASCVGTNTINVESARRLINLLAPPEERQHPWVTPEGDRCVN